MIIESNPNSNSELNKLLKKSKSPLKISNNWLQELVILLNYALPVIGTHLLEHTLLVVSIISVGHLSTIHLAAASLANITLNCTNLSLIIGFASALDTLCPQAFTSHYPQLTTIYALRTSLIILLLIFPQILFNFNSRKIFILLGQDLRLAQLASDYLKVISFGLPGYGTFEITRRWLQAQHIMYPSTIILLFVAPLNALLSYLLVWGPQSIRLGFIGAPIATATSFNLMGLLSLLYCILLAPHSTWPGFTFVIFQDLGLNFKFGLSGFTMIASEWWCWELIGLASSLLGPSTLAAQSVITTISALTFQFPNAMATAAAVRCGNLLGSGRSTQTQLAAYVAFGAGIGVGLINMALMVVCRRLLGRLFSSEEDVIQIVADVLVLVALFQIPDGLTTTLGGVFRGAGKPKIGAVINSVGYYAIGLPIGLFLTFSKTTHFGAFGLWAGMTIAVTITALISSYYLFNLIDFKEAMMSARDRIDESQEDHQEVTNYGTINNTLTL
ncbi:hypothetical protein O181_047323 [Austropuccinia psidii MF-1]|uniref:MATE efflux family protein n=1 Tax=Austropuccinia psidii MF-1 TaxID=1389203 RepID=A0A9Q3HJD9_9BASI|nr:hypothetical protein [Austropuccinia psidii MF-1]